MLLERERGQRRQCLDSRGSVSTCAGMGWFGTSTGLTWGSNSVGGGKAYVPLGLVHFRWTCKPERLCNRTFARAGPKHMMIEVMTNAHLQHMHSPRCMHAVMTQSLLTMLCSNLRTGMHTQHSMCTVHRVNYIVGKHAVEDMQG